MIEYKHRPREKRLKEIIIGQSLVTFVILASSLCLVFWGFGYRMNWSNFSIRHSGIIYIQYSPRDAEIYLNDEKIDGSSPITLRQYAGRYQTTVRKSGYNDWTQSVKLENDKVLSFKNLTLFKKDPAVSEITDERTIGSINTPYDTLVKNPSGGLYSSDYEIWYQDDMVTRFSQPISGVIWYPGGEYIAFQQAKEIRIIEKNGTNDVALVQLSSASPTKFLFSWDGTTLLYKDGDKYYKAEIN